MSREGSFKTPDGLDLFERCWQPDGDLRANLVLIHGYGEHSGRFDHVAGALNGIGVAVHAYDQRGFGRSPGKRGYIRRFDDLLDDLTAYLEHVRERTAHRPLFLMGHSMGGLVIALYVQARQLDARGLVFSSALLAINDEVSPVLIALANVLGVLTPWLPVADLDTTTVSRDPEVVRAYDADPLNHHGKILARTGSQLNTAIKRARTNFEAITLPVYVIHGSGDRLVPAEGSQLLHDRCRSADKTCKIYEGGYHELHNDLDKASAIAGLCDWIAERSGR